MCKSCASGNQRKFSTEISIHFPGLRNLDKPQVLVFPKALICMDCGFTEFAMPKAELGLLKRDGAGDVTGASPVLESHFSFAHDSAELRVSRWPKSVSE